MRRHCVTLTDEATLAMDDCENMSAYISALVVSARGEWRDALATLAAESSSAACVGEALPLLHGCSRYGEGPVYVAAALSRDVDVMGWSAWAAGIARNVELRAALCTLAWHRQYNAEAIDRAAAAALGE